MLAGNREVIGTAGYDSHSGFESRGWGCTRQTGCWNRSRIYKYYRSYKGSICRVQRLMRILMNKELEEQDVDLL